MKKMLLLLLSLMCMAVWSSLEAKNTVYAGSIGPYKIHMVLNSNMQGYYYYDKNPNSHFKLTLSRKSNCADSEHGTRQSCQKITLQEYAPNSGKNTGQFSGTMISEYESGYVGYEFSGTFTNKTNGKKYSFQVYGSEKVK